MSKNHLSPVSSAKFKTIGDWNDALRKLAGLDSNIKNACLKAQIVIATQILTKVRNHLRRQDLGWRALSKKYAKAKKRKGLDSRTLISRGTYLANINLWTSGGGWNVFIGVKKGIFNHNLNGRKNKVDIATIATYHEFARKKKRKRALWNPSIAELGSVVGIKRMYISEIEKGLRRKGYGPWLKKLKKL